jgi:hypothetical protein
VHENILRQNLSERPRDQRATPVTSSCVATARLARINWLSTENVFPFVLFLL